MISKGAEEQIIYRHLMGFTRDEIADITNVSTGAVSNKINEWKKRTGILDVDEIRQITTLIRKADVDIRQCAKGFRIFQLLKKFKIIEENNDVDSDLNSLSFFVTEIYLKCKEYGLSPNTITSWLLDLLNFTVKNYQYLHTGNSPTSPAPSLTTVEQRDVNEAVPSVSLISDFIEEKKKQLEQLFQVEKDTRHSIKNYEEQINELTDKIAHLRQEKESILAFYQTFTQLENTLKKDCNIDLRKDLKPFSKLFSEFRENGYNVTNIVNQYNKSIKLQYDIKLNENQIQIYNNQLAALQQEISFHQTQLDMHKKNWDLYIQLEAMKFGIDELKQLWLTVSEIKVHDNSPKDFDMVENPVAFFMKDVEDNYHDKLKFEDRVNAKRQELSMLNAQVNVGKQNLLSQPFIAPTLLSLFKKGISEQDIIEMSYIFNDSQTIQSLPIDDLKSEENSSDSGGNVELKGWKKLRDELKKYGGLKAAMKEQNDQLLKIEREYSSLVYRTQTIGIIYQNLINLINFTYTSISHYCHCKETIDVYYREIDSHRRKINLILILFVTLVAGDTKEDIDERRKTTVNDSNKDFEYGDVDNHTEGKN